VVEYLKLIRSNNLDVNTIIFSKDRALQLDATLRSCYRHNDYNDTHVIYKTSTEDHKKSYEDLKTSFPTTNFHEERYFKNDVESLLEKKFVVFICDDTIFTRDFDLYKITKFFETNNELLSFSLRLGENTTQCYSMSTDQKIPQHMVGDEFMAWHWMKSEYDFAYPMELSSSFMRSSDVISAIQSNLYNHPNGLEDTLYRSLGEFVDKPWMMSYQTSVAFSNPANKTQISNPNNRSNHKIDQSPDNLLKLFNDGYRIDVSKFDGYVTKAAHEEVDFEYVK
jgi:hypothetical protein